MPITSTVQQRHNQLRHHLPARVAQRRVDEAWLCARFADYLRVTARPVVLTLTREGYLAHTGRFPPADAIGMTYRVGESEHRVIFLDIARIHSRGQAELELAHEMMHAQWWSYRHRPIAFVRAQELIDRVSAVA